MYGLEAFSLSSLFSRSSCLCSLPKMDRTLPKNPVGASSAVCSAACSASRRHLDNVTNDRLSILDEENDLFVLRGEMHRFK